VTKAQLLADIDIKIFENSDKAITGQILNEVLHNMVEFSDNSTGIQTLTLNTNTGRLIISGGNNVDLSTFINSFIVPSARLFPNPLYIQPVSALSTSPLPGTYEMGASVLINFTGSYTQNSGGTSTGYKLIKNNNTGSPLSTNPSFSETIVMTGSTVTYYGIYSANAGTVQLNDDFGNITANPIAAGDHQSPTLSFVGSYKIFYGSGASNPTSSAIVRALPSFVYNNQVATNFVLNTGSTNKKFIACMPFARSITKVIDLDAGNLDITSLYVLQGLGTINDGGGTSYPVKIYMMEVGAAYSSNHRHEITYS
jgi:hypothetical protein